MMATSDVAAVSLGMACGDQIALSYSKNRRCTLGGATHNLNLSTIVIDPLALLPPNVSTRSTWFLQKAPRSPHGCVLFAGHWDSGGDLRVSCPPSVGDSFRASHDLASIIGLVTISLTLQEGEAPVKRGTVWGA